MAGTIAAMFFFGIILAGIVYICAGIAGLIYGLFLRFTRRRKKDSDEYVDIGFG